MDEFDVGNVRDGQRATFTVNAFPGRTFEGLVHEQVRFGLTQRRQNVAKSTVIISVENPGHQRKLGMTANLRIETERRDDVVRIPNAALAVEAAVRRDSLKPPRRRPSRRSRSPAPSPADAARWREARRGGDNAANWT